MNRIKRIVQALELNNRVARHKFPSRYLTLQFNLKFNKHLNKSCMFPHYKELKLIR